MDNNEVAWLAGLLEGEGYFYDSKKLGRIGIRCAMTDRDIIERIQKVTGVGYINFRKKRKHQTKDVWEWGVGNRREVLSLIRAVRSWMGERRSQRIEEMEEYNKKNPLKRQEKGRVQHGTRAKYSKYGCRCEPCKFAEHKYYLKRVERRNAKKNLEKNLVS